MIFRRYTWYHWWYKRSLIITSQWRWRSQRRIKTKYFGLRRAEWLLVVNCIVVCVHAPPTLGTVHARNPPTEQTTVLAPELTCSLFECWDTTESWCYHISSTTSVSTDCSGVEMWHWCWALLTWTLISVSPLTPPLVTISSAQLHQRSTGQHSLLSILLHPSLRYSSRHRDTESLCVVSTLQHPCKYHVSPGNHQTKISLSRVLIYLLFTVLSSQSSLKWFQSASHTSLNTRSLIFNLIISLKNTNHITLF